MIGKIRLLFVMGFVVLFLPYIEVPFFWKTLLTILLGVGILVTTYRIRKVYKFLKFKLSQETRSEEPVRVDIHA